MFTPHLPALSSLRRTQQVVTRAVVGLPLAAAAVCAQAQTEFLKPVPFMATGAALAPVGTLALAQQRPGANWPTPLVSGDPGLPPTAPQLRVGLSFVNADPYANLRRGALMKVELSGQTALTLRPRGGRLSLVVSSRW